MTNEPGRQAPIMASTVQKYPLFQNLPTKEIETVTGYLEILHCESGKALLIPGQTPDFLYLIANGHAVVEAVGQSIQNPILAELGEGDCFPLEALYQNRQVFSTFRAVEDTTFLCLPSQKFREMLDTSPGFQRVCQERSESLVSQARRLYQRQLTSQRDYQSLDSPLSAIVRDKPVTSPPEASVQTVLQQLAEHRAEMAVIVDEQDHPVGIFTLSDLLHRVALKAYPQEAAIQGAMTQNPKSLPGTALGSEAAVEMARHGHRQVLVVEHGKLTGLVTERDLFGLQRVGLAQIAESIRQAGDIEVLVRCSAEVGKLSHNLLDQGVRSEQLTRIISTLNDHLVQQIVRLAGQEADIGDISFCWLALGSEGRHEQTITSDQDNAILFQLAEGQKAEAVRNRLLPFARQVNQNLARCGFPLCKGDIMAGNPKWCLSLEEWERLFKSWIATPSPEALLNATIFFDFRPLFGNSALASSLRARIAEPAKSNSRFLHLMVENALERSPPLGMLRDFTTDGSGTIDLKLSGIAIFVDAARILSLAHGISEVNTYQRLRFSTRQRKISERESGAWLNAFDFLQHLRLRLQHEQHVQGLTPGNRVSPDSLNDLDRRFLIEALRQAGKLQKSLQYYKLREHAM